MRGSEEEYKTPTTTKSLTRTVRNADRLEESDTIGQAVRMNLGAGLVDRAQVMRNGRPVSEEDTSFPLHFGPSQSGVYTLWGNPPINEGDVIKFSNGETIVWQGPASQDVYKVQVIPPGTQIDLTFQVSETDSNPILHYTFGLKRYDSLGPPD